MRYLLTLSFIALPAIFLVAGCGGGGSQGGSPQGGQEERPQPQHGGSEKLDLRPEGDSGVSGTASFKDGPPDGVVVRLELRGLPKPDTSYLAHIHPGTCAEEAEEHAHDDGEHPGEGGGREEEEYVFGHGEEGEGGEGEISYALTQVRSNPEGRGSSNTAFGQTSVDRLFSSEPKKHVMVHEAGSGNPPVLACADLERAG